MPQLYPHRLFVSHAWSYGDNYDRMIALLDNANNFDYRNFSVPQAEAFERTSKSLLQEKIRGQIRPVQVVLIVAGMYVNNSDWIQFEMDFARSLGKPVIGVRPYGSERVPQAVVNASGEMVNWSTVSVVDAIRRAVR